ncbi:MAG: twin-arginine translocation signal domain-containing protein [Planctomycetota bacterium]|jgi:N-dimethylarginine dimethylaminohydrolase
MSEPKTDRRTFIKVSAGAAAAVAATGLSIPSSQAEEKKTVSDSEEFIPGMRQQGKGIKCYVQSDYAPLKACMVGNPSTIYVPDPDTWEMSNLFAHESDEFMAYLRKHRGKRLKDADPKVYDKMAHEFNALADAYRKNGVRVIRNETGETPREIVEYNTSWSGQKQMTLYGQSAWEVFGHCLVSLWEVSVSFTEFAVREAVVEIMKNDPEAVWLTMPALYPTADRRPPGPFLSPGDPLIFDKTVVIGIGVSDPSHIKDRSKPRSSGDEFGAEILRRMLKPFGWKVKRVYFNSKLTYHIDCLVSLLEEGLMAYPKGKDAFWTPLPKEFQDWEVMDVSLEDHKMGISNNEPLGGKKIVLPRGSKRFVKDLEKRGWTCIEIPYSTIWDTFHSGIHCSTASIWRES